MPQVSSPQPDLTRRGFVQALGGASALATFGSRTAMANLFAGPTPNSAAETAVTEFYNSLSEKQLLKTSFPFNHSLRSKINAAGHQGTNLGLAD